MTDPAGRYSRLLEKIFFSRYRTGATQIPFQRADLSAAATQLHLVLPKNLGDIVYAARYRTPLPKKILDTQPAGMQWVIEGAGPARYVFRLAPATAIVPNPALVSIKIPDATPEIVTAYALTDEQALLARVRYNRLIDIFLGLTAYSLQNHLRTTVTGVGQIEIDEIYIGIDKYGRQYVLPVQAKGGGDRLSVVQTKQDTLCCAQKYPDLICRPVSAQFMADDVIALFELTVQGDEIKIVEERQYRLVPAEEISTAELQAYSRRSERGLQP